MKGHGAEIDQIEAAFENELSLAEENVRSVFKVCLIRFDGVTFTYYYTICIIHSMHH